MGCAFARSESSHGTDPSPTGDYLRKIKGSIRTVAKAMQGARVFYLSKVFFFTEELIERLFSGRDTKPIRSTHESYTYFVK